jgi:hypothetical protein
MEEAVEKLREGSVKLRRLRKLTERFHKITDNFGRYPKRKLYSEGEDVEIITAVTAGNCHTRERLPKI